MAAPAFQIPNSTNDKPSRSRHRRALLLIALGCTFLPSLVIAADDDAVEPLWKQWKSGDDQAFAKLAQLGPECRILAPRIVESVCNSNDSADWDASELRLLTEMRADAVPAVVEGLKRRPRDASRMELVEQLKIIGPMARQAGDELLKIAVEETGDLRDAALQGLAAARVKKDYVIPELVRVLSQSNLYDSGIHIPLKGPDQRAAAAAATLEKCPDGRALVPLIRTARFHPNAQVREWALLRAAAADGLSGFHPLPKEAIEALKQATRDEFLTVRFSAEDALASIQNQPAP
jgi:HEAT repeat protein